MSRACRHAALVLLVAVAGTACASNGTGPLSFEDVSTAGAGEMPPSGPFAEGRSGDDGGTILAPVSASIAPATAYRFSLGHCGLASPIDVDGSFWDPVEGVTAGGGPLDLQGASEMINATSGFFVIIGDDARFRTESGSVLSLERHDGEKEFPGCD